MTWKSFKSESERLLDNLDKHEVIVLSGSLAYTTALALAPFLVIMLSATSFLGHDSQVKLVNEMTELLGPEAGAAVSGIVASAEKGERFRGLSGIFSFAIVIISASAIFSQLRFALDKVNERKPGKNSSGILAFLRERVLSIGLVLGFIFLMILSLFITTGISAVFSGREGLFWTVVNFFASLFLFSGLFASMFRFIPSDKFAWRRCLVSGISAAVFFIAGKSLIGLYLGKSAVGSAYGAAGSLAVLLVWLYYSSLTLLASYEFTNTVILENAPELKAQAPVS